MRHTAAKTGAAVLFLTGTLVLTGCSMDDDSESMSSGSDNSTAMSEESSDDMATETTDPSMGMMDPAANLVGPGCQQYADMVPDGPGSIEGMSGDPVAVAASNNPMLKTLTDAVSGKLNPDVDLVDTLNSDEFTVFAPTDDAFAKIDDATLDSLKTDSDTLSDILTYHVVPGRVLPSDLEGMHKTVEGKNVEVSGSEDALKVNDASVVCGGVETSNATVYLIDSVLMPPEA